MMNRPITTGENFEYFSYRDQVKIPTSVLRSREFFQLLPDDLKLGVRDQSKLNFSVLIRKNTFPSAIIAL